MNDRLTIKNMSIRNGQQLYRHLKEAYQATGAAALALDRFDPRATQIIEDYQLIASYIQHLMRKTAELNAMTIDLIASYED